jgi:hypothetical protein
MRESKWYDTLLNNQDSGTWPIECDACKRQEDENLTSVRQASNNKHKLYSAINPDYVFLDISPNNICNSACQTCSPDRSTFYGKVFGKKMMRKIGDNQVFDLLTDNVVQMDLSGGEPLYSQLTLNVLKNLPKNVKWLRVNTNASNYYDFTEILERGIICELTLSLDGVDKVFDYTRWPLKWSEVSDNIERWLELRSKNSRLKLDINTVVSALNIGNLADIDRYASARNIPIFYSKVRRIDELDVRYKNFLTLAAKDADYNATIATGRDNTEELLAFLEKNDKIRGIDYKDFLL